jgi:hypothetical protein
VLIALAAFSPLADWANFSVIVGGAGGIIYALTVIRHARKQTAYSPDAEDWVSTP